MGTISTDKVERRRRFKECTDKSKYEARKFRKYDGGAFGREGGKNSTKWWNMLIVGTRGTERKRERGTDDE